MNKFLICKQHLSGNKRENFHNVILKHPNLQVANFVYGLKQINSDVVSMNMQIKNMLTQNFEYILIS